MATAYLFSFISLCANFILVCCKVVLLITSWDLRTLFIELDLCFLVENPRVRGKVLKVGLNGLEDMGRGWGEMCQGERVAWTYIHYQM